MSYKFIIGSAGSGKTRKAFEECIFGEKEKRYLILVPEQSTMITQKQIVDMHPNHATTNIDVLSFNRLAYRIFQELGIEHPDVIDDIAKALIVKRVALAKKEDLQNYKKILDKPGFISEMKSIISEFYQYGITPDELMETLPQIQRAHLKTKLSETALIYRGFQDFIEEKFITTEEVLDLLCRVLPDSKILQQAYVVLDGFTGFTPIQLRIIEIFLMQAKEVTITMNCDSLQEAYAHIDVSDLFYLSKSAIQKITELAVKQNVKHDEDIWVERHSDIPALQHLERHFLRFDRFRPISCEERISITRLQDMDEEIRFVTSKILQLVQEGIRYREIAIVCRDLSNYKDGLTQRLEKLGVPVFVDETIEIINNPLIAFIQSVLSLASQPLTDVNLLMYLKNRPDTDEDLIWQLELYLNACGIRYEKKLLSHWRYIPKELSGIDLAKLMEFRDVILEEIRPLRETFAKTVQAERVVPALTDLMEYFSFRERLEKMAKIFSQKEESNAKKKVREYANIYEQVEHVLWNISEILKDEDMDKTDILQIFASGVSEIRVGLIPASIDNVVFGDLIRTRLGEVKVLFIVGANEGTLISTKSQNAILTDRDKEELSDLGVVLSSTMKEDIFIQRYYLYLMFTKAREKLFITFAGRNHAQNALKEANVLSQLKKLYTDLDVVYMDSIHEVYSTLEAKECLVQALRESEQKEEDIKKWLPYVVEAAALMDAAAYQYVDGRISKEAADLLYGMELIASATRLEQFVDCPYKHFLRYGLGVKEEAEYHFQSMDIGTLAHSIIEKCFVLCKKEEQEIITLSESQRSALVDRCVEMSLLEDEKGITTENFKNQHLVQRIASMVKRMLSVLCIQLEKGEFKPEYFEKTFRVKDGLSTLSFDLDGEHRLLLTGAIDRVDLLESEEQILLKIIDYKTGSTKWETDLTYYGKQLQLVLYLSAMKEVLKAKEHKDVIPAAFLYMHLADPLIDVSGIDVDLDDAKLREWVQDEMVSTLKPSGVVNANPKIIQALDATIEKKSSVIPVTLKDGNIVESSSSVASRERIEKLEQFVKRKILEIGKQMVDGDVSISPGNRKGKIACTYCPYYSICGFDKKTKGFRYRNMPSLSNAKAWELMAEEDEDAME